MDARRRFSLSILILLLAILGLVPLIWPGDAPWINDEPKLVELAMLCKESGMIPSHGLMGSRGILYGPFPLWTYTALLHVTDDLVDLVRLKALLMTLITAVALVWIAALCRSLDPPAGALALLSPCLWLYHRQLWDNPFLIPLAALSAAAYLAFCVRPTAWKLWLAGFALTGMFLTHLMSVPWIVAVVANFAWAQRARLRVRGANLPGIVLVSGLLTVPYLMKVFSGQPETVLQEGSPWKGWLFPLMGGRFFSSFDMDYFLGERWPSAGWVSFFHAVTWIAIPLVWLGIAQAARRVWARLKTGEDLDAESHATLICAAALAAQCLLNGLTRTYGHPHYYNATWICSFYFLWVAFSAIPFRRLAQAAYAASLAVVLGFIIGSLHTTAGNQTIHYGPALAEQIRIAREVAHYHPASPVYPEIQNYRLFPHAFRVIKKFYGFDGVETAPLTPLVIRARLPASEEGRLSLDVMPQ